MKPITIIIPSFNNEEFLNPCVYSIIRSGVLDGVADLIIVNNGKQDIERVFGGVKQIKILNQKENLGWEGGLELGIKESKTPFLVFQNDDTFLPPSGASFYHRLLMRFSDDNVAAVGPVTTCAAGVQSVYNPNCPLIAKEVPWMIFFTVMVRRSHLEAVGGIDTSLPGGDDLDLSIRFRKAGYNLVVDPGAFIIHHGFKTGERVKGTPNVKYGWNSIEMSDRTNQYLIKKHGFKTWWSMMRGLNYPQSASIDLEGNLVRSFVNGDKNIVEFGCGPMKTVERAVGIDRIPKGQEIPLLNGKISVADITADVTEEIPLEEKSQDIIIARHVLEHIVDSIETVKKWKKVLRIGGKMIVAVPDERVTMSIPLNMEHVHAFTMESMKNLMESCGLKEIKSKSAENGVSFVGCYERLN